MFYDESINTKLSNYPRFGLHFNVFTSFTVKAIMDTIHTLVDADVHEYRPETQQTM